MEQMPKAIQNDPHQTCAHVAHMRSLAIKTAATLALIGMTLSGCGGSAPPSPDISNTDTKSIARTETRTAEPFDPQSAAAHYLAARQALFMSEIEDSAHFYMRSLEAEPDNVEFLQRNFMSQYYLGHI
jgi:hypothetical protein